MSVDMGPEPEHGHHHRTGHKWLDLTLAVSAITISLISMFLALQHGHVMEKMVEATTWPFVTAGVSNAEYDYSRHSRLIIVNKGVGPAKIETFEAFYDGVAQPGPHALLHALLKPVDLKDRTDPILRADVLGLVLTAKEEVNFLDFNVKAFSPEEYQTIAQAITDDLHFRICYCSVLDDCWVLDDRKVPVRPVRVKACEAVRTPYTESQ
jgi:hypothetical protein